MKALFLLTCLSLCAADLGVISPRHGILLRHGTTRPDFQQFEVELKPADTTNAITLTLKTNLLTVDDLVRLPSGRIVMGLRAHFADGSVSGMSINTFDLRRADPPMPSARRVALSGPPEPPKPLINEMERLRGASTIPPMPSRTLPGHPEGNYFSTNIANWRPNDITELMSRTNPITWNPADYTNQEPDERVWTDVSIRFMNDVTTIDASTNLNVTRRNYVFHPSAISAGITVDVPSTVNMLQEQTGSNIVFVPKPLTGATNQSYAEYLDWLADRKGKRRNE